jgi:hypothetical protein
MTARKTRATAKARDEADPCGMTTREANARATATATAAAKAEADSQRE